MSSSRIRYQPDEKPSLELALGLGVQLTVLTVAGTIIIPLVVMRAGGAAEPYHAWAVFTAVAICGVATVLQVFRAGWIGAGHVLVMGSSGAFIAISITAVAAGGPAMLATLVVIAGLFQLVLSGRLSLLRRVLTPTVTGTFIMLLPVTVMPIVFELLQDVPDGAPAPAPPLSACATLLVIAAIALQATGALRLWAPIIGVVAGSLVAGAYGLYDIERVAETPWIGIPDIQWPGFDLDFGPEFWALLPAFLLVALIGTIRTISSAIAIQRISWRRPRAVDFRAVQGAVTVDGIGNLLSGLAGTVPNTAYSMGASVIEITGVAARRVGIATGLVFVALAFIPKALAVVLAIPGPVAAAYLTVLLAGLFVVGMKVVIQDGIDGRKSLIVGVAFWVGVGFQSGVIFPKLFSDFAGGLLENGITAGGLTAILMTLFVEFTQPRRSRMEASFDMSVLPRIQAFIGVFAARNGWDDAMAERLQVVCEESLLTLLEYEEAQTERRQRRLQLAARKSEGGAVLEFVVGSREENIQDKLALLGEHVDEARAEREASLRMLRHLATSVHHQQYRGKDILSIRVETTGG